MHCSRAAQLSTQLSHLEHRQNIDHLEFVKKYIHIICSNNYYSNCPTCHISLSDLSNKEMDTSSVRFMSGLYLFF